MLSEFKKLTRLSAIYGAGSLLNSIIGFLLIPIYSRNVSTADYGIYSLFVITGQVVSLIALMGLSAAMFREIIYRQSDEKTVISTAFNSLSLVTVAFFGLLILLAPHISALLFKGEHVDLLRLILVSSGLSNFGYIALSTLQIREQAVRYSRLMVIRFVIGVLFNILFIVVFHMGLTGLVLAELVMTSTAMLMYLWILRHDLRPQLSRPILRSMLRYGLPLIPFQLASIVLTSSDRYFLEHSAGADQVGIYSMGYKIAMIVQIIVSAVHAAWSAQMFAIAKEDNAPRRYARILTYYAASIGFLGLAVSVVARDVIIIMADPSYHEAYIVVPIIVLSAMAFGGVNMTNVALNIKGRTELNAPIIVAVAIGNLGLNYLMIPPYGMMGAAWATLISYVALLVIEVLVNQRIWHLPFEYRRMFKIILAWGGVYAASLWIDTGNAWLNLVFKGIVLLVFPLVLYAFRFFEPSELASAYQMLTRLTGWLRMRSKNESLKQVDK